MIEEFFKIIISLEHVTSEIIDVFYYMITYCFSILAKVERDSLQEINMAFLTIFISVAIAIFSGQKEFEVLDKNVILDCVQARLFLFYLGLIYLPLLFWDILPVWFRFVVWAIGIYFMLEVLIKSYHWMKGNKFKLRFAYSEKLKKSKNVEEIVESWRSVWQKKIVEVQSFPDGVRIYLQNELEFLSIFSSTIEGLLSDIERSLDNKKAETIAELLYDFNGYADQRSIESLIFPYKDRPAFLQKILEWYLTIQRLENKLINEKDGQLPENKPKNEKDRRFPDKWYIFSPRSSLESIIRQILRCTFKNPSNFYRVSEVYNEYVRIYSEYVRKSKDDKAISLLWEEFLKAVENPPEEDYVWRLRSDFPGEWKIKKNNLEDKENIMPHLLWHYFCAYFRNWVHPILTVTLSGGKLNNSLEDKTLGDVLKILFPEVDSRLWARILFFVFYPDRGDGNKMKQIIELSRNLNLLQSYQPYAAWTSREDDIEERYRKIKEEEEKAKRSTYELTPLLLSFSKEKLEECINNLKNLKYGRESAEESERESERKEYLEMLENLKKMLKKSE